ncbi:hypothetical protein [Syntrophomonas erecta]
MTNFLPAGIIKDTITDILAKSTELQKDLTEQRLFQVKQGLKDIEDMAAELAVFLERLSCEPLIYTGTGTTEEVIKRLEWALVFTEEVDPIEYINYREGKKISKSGR